MITVRPPCRATTFSAFLGLQYKASGTHGQVPKFEFSLEIKHCQLLLVYMNWFGCNALC